MNGADLIDPRRLSEEAESNAEEEDVQRNHLECPRPLHLRVRVGEPPVEPSVPGGEVGEGQGATESSPSPPPPSCRHLSGARGIPVRSGGEGVAFDGLRRHNRTAGGAVGAE